MNDKQEKKPKISYKIRTIRCSDKAWEEFKQMRWRSQKGWDKFLLELTKNK